MTERNRHATYRSSIPQRAKEKVVERYPNGAKKKCEYRMGRELVGVRMFDETGEPGLEWGVRNGKMHGRFYDWSCGAVICMEPYTNSVAHGTAFQWDENGRLLGTYTMRHGSGIDLWRQNWGKRIYLVEVHYMKVGVPHGWEWWINDNQRTVCDETHWHRGELHGIQRRWNNNGRLLRGFPKYWIHNKQVTKRIYVKACSSDPDLPSFRLIDNRPSRTFPPEIEKHLYTRTKSYRSLKRKKK